MSAGVAGAMTGLPGLCFGVVGALAVAFARRVGMTAGIAIGLAAAAAGLLLRVATDSVPLFLLLTVVALSGMAVGNVLVPAWVKAHGHAVVLMTVYGTGLVVGATVAVLVTAPVTEADGLVAGGPRDVGRAGRGRPPALGVARRCASAVRRPSTASAARRRRAA